MVMSMHNSNNKKDSSGMSSSRDRELPVFTFPNELRFHADDKDSWRQILTLYNPYDFPIKYRVFCTAPKSYSVVEAQGTVKPSFCADIVIRLNSSHLLTFDHSDKFRVQIYEATGSSSFGALLGKKTVSAVLTDAKPPKHDSTAGSDLEEAFSQAQSSSATSSPAPVQWQPGRQPANSSQYSTLSPVVFVLAVVCIAALCLPTENATINSHLPVYLHLTINQKLVAAYVLGLVTMVVFRS